MCQSTFIALSADQFLPEEVKQMERTILDSIRWRLNNPTASMFARSFQILPVSVTSSSMLGGWNDHVSPVSPPHQDLGDQQKF